MPYLYDNKDAEFLNQFKLLLTGQYQGAQVSPSGANRFRKGSHGRENEWRRLQIGFEAVFFKNRLTLHSLTNMGELDGMETARRLRAADAGLQLVFVTGYAEHVFDGYSVGALGYLLKPPKAEQLEEVLDRAQAALVRDLDRAYICRSGDTHYRIPIANILYFVSDRRQVACVTAGREYTFYGKLDTVAAEVGADFVRIHQRYLVRTGAVDRMEGGEVVLRDGRRLPVSRSCQPSALLAFTRAELEG